MRVSVIVPVLYAEPQLGDTLQRLVALRPHTDLEILVVVDVPDPAREGEARAANEPESQRASATVLYRMGQRGFGSALRFGFGKASGEVLVPFMADGCDDARDIPRMMERIAEGWEVVAGSRYIPGGAIVGNTAKQRASRLYSMVMRRAGGPSIHDVSNAFKAYRRAVIERVQTEGESFDVSVELAVKAHKSGFRITEIPTVWTNRMLGASNFRIARELRHYGRWLLFAATHRRDRPVPTVPPQAERIRPT